MSISDDIAAASEAINRNDLAQAEALVQSVEAQLADREGERAHDTWANLAAIMIDLGARAGREDLLEKGTSLTVRVLKDLPEAAVWPGLYYNAANGYLALWERRKSAALHGGLLDDTYLQAKAYYRKALQASSHRPGDLPRDLRCQILVNYANCLHGMGRSVEAISLYDQALALDPGMPQALGNKAVTLYHLAFLAEGHTHLFLAEARRLLQEALQGPTDAHAEARFEQVLSRIDRVIQAHPQFQTEPVESEPAKSPFHEFLRKYCARNQLFLTPTALVGRHDALVFGDPMFITHMAAPLDDDAKFDRYITFLDQIKEDYVLARYLLVQSQYRSPTVDAIDAAVTLYYPLDYSLHGAYINMLKTSTRLATDVLDKIANFVRDYCGLSSPSESSANFRNIWSERSSRHTLRPELAAQRNRFIYALFDLSLDLGQGGPYGFAYERRNALTHRFLAVHDPIAQAPANADIPRVTLPQFLDECLLTMQIARAALMYLILFVDSQERRSHRGDHALAIQGTPVDDALRWTPAQSD